MERMIPQQSVQLSVSFWSEAFDKKTHIWKRKSVAAKARAQRNKHGNLSVVGFQNDDLLPVYFRALNSEEELDTILKEVQESNQYLDILDCQPVEIYAYLDLKKFVSKYFIRFLDTQNINRFLNSITIEKKDSTLEKSPDLFSLFIEGNETPEEVEKSFDDFYNILLKQEAKYNQLDVQLRIEISCFGANLDVHEVVKN